MNGGTVALGDIHFPFESKRGIRLALEAIGDLKPKLVVQVGDLYDLFSFSKYPRSHNLITPEKECKLARQKAAAFWASVRLRAPKAELVQLRGNHDDRAGRRALEALAPAEHIINEFVRQLMTFDGVRTIHDSAEEFIKNGVCFQHGHMTFGAHARWNQMNTVTGHLHRAGVMYFQNAKGLYWEFNVGWLGDLNAPVFNYRAQKKLHGTTLGIGHIDENLNPRFLAF